MKPIKLTAYDSHDRPTTDYGRAVGWAMAEDDRPKHRGRCKAYSNGSWDTDYAESLGTAPDWVIYAERARREALRKEREGK